MAGSFAKQQVKTIVESHPGLTKKQIAAAIKQFIIYDDNESQRLDKIECAHAMVVLGLDWEADKFDAVFSRYDKNGDGTLDLHEYLGMIETGTTSKDTNVFFKKVESKACTVM